MAAFLVIILSLLSVCPDVGMKPDLPVASPDALVRSVIALAGNCFCCRACIKGMCLQMSRPDQGAALHGPR